jgi:hypothetical protein
LDPLSIGIANRRSLELLLSSYPIRKEDCMDGHKILVPYNFTSNDEKSIDLVIRTFGQHQDAEITLFHSYIPVPDIDVSDKTVMSRMAGSLSYLRQKITELEGDIIKARDRLVSAGFTDERVNYVFKPQEKDAAQEIIDQANKGKYTALVLSRSPGSIRKFFTLSVSKKVTKALQNLELYMVG